MSTTEEKIAVMQAYLDGKPIEYISPITMKWQLCTKPFWNWPECDYRVAVTKPSIPEAVIPYLADWVHWAVKNANGSIYFHEDKPSLPSDDSPFWLRGSGEVSDTDNLAIDPGTCDWKDSLVEIKR